jgi:hypothetical protein
MALKTKTAARYGANCKVHHEILCLVTRQFETFSELYRADGACESRRLNGPMGDISSVMSRGDHWMSFGIFRADNDLRTGRWQYTAGSGRTIESRSSGISNEFNLTIRDG